MPQYRKFNDYLIEQLKEPEEAGAFLENALEIFEEDNNMEALMLALRLITEAQGGVSRLSEETQLNRQNLYKVLTGKITPRFDTALAIIKGLGFRFTIQSGY